MLVTGSRSWTDKERISAVLKEICTEFNVTPAEMVLVHGAAAGADSLAEVAALEMGMETEVHPADWEKFGRRAGYLRNAEMVEAGANVVLAFWDGSSKGTAMTMKLALNAGMDLRVLKNLAL